MSHEPANSLEQPERRAWKRAESTRPFPRRLFRADSGQPLDAMIVDLSRGGVALVLEEEPPPLGVVVYLELESEPSAPPVKVWANIVRREPEGCGSWRVGCEFLSGLSAEEITAILD